MANILGIKGLSTVTLNTLIAAYGNDMVNLVIGNGYGLALTPNINVEFESLLQSLFFKMVLIVLFLLMERAGQQSI